MAFNVTNKVPDNCVITANPGDGSWDIDYKLQNGQTELVDFRFEYAHGDDTYFMMKTATKIKNLDDYQDDLIINFLTKETEIAELKHLLAGSYIITLPVKKNTDNIKINIKPDVITGAGSLMVYVDEDNVKGNRYSN